MKNYDLFGNEVIEDVLLRDKFIEPPFSVLDTRSGSWQNRKRLWTSKGIKSELGRMSELTYRCDRIREFDHYRVKNGDRNRTDDQGTSVFDPALTELIYRWFCIESGSILDPFAGGSVRGIVANYLGYHYTGIELRQEQVESNREQALKILPVNNQPQWYVGDSDKILDGYWLNKFDLIFTCPPYVDLEVYSNIPDDLSNMPYDKFLDKYNSIIKKSTLLLKKGGYAVIVVGEVRDKHGYYYDFVSDTKKSFINSGLKLYNDAILLNVIGTACVRAGKQFESSRKLVKIHQNVLVFKKV